MPPAGTSTVDGLGLACGGDDLVPSAKVMSCEIVPVLASLTSYLPAFGDLDVRRLVRDVDGVSSTVPSTPPVPPGALARGRGLGRGRPGGRERPAGTRRHRRARGRDEHEKDSE